MKRAAAIFACAALLGLSACAADQYEPMGASVRQAVQSQKLAAEVPPDTPVTGLDGVYTQGVMKNYQKAPEACQAKGDNKGSNLGALLGAGASKDK